MNLTDYELCLLAASRAGDLVTATQKGTFSDRVYITQRTNAIQALEDCVIEMKKREAVNDGSDSHAA